MVQFVRQETFRNSVHSLHALAAYREIEMAAYLREMEPAAHDVGLESRWSMILSSVI